MSKDILRDLRGFGTVEKWVLTDPKINIHAKAIYSLLCAYAGGKDSAFPSVDTLTVQLNISKDTIYKYIKELREKGVIEVEQIREGGRFSRNIYTLLNYNPNMILTESGSTGHGNTVTDTTVADQVDTKNNRTKSNRLKSNSNKTPIPPQGADGDLPKPDETELKPKEDPSKPEKKPEGYSEKFEQWWALYPRKTGKGAAWKKWKSEKLEKRFDELIEKLEQQNAMQHAFMNPQYIVGASRYLNEARYDDEVVFLGGSNETNSGGNQRKESTMERARRKQREFRASLDSESA
ncbi:helix-turn-helix domain-containing protein [Ignatzschineria rhizosphaerae]|uniref:Helix-turn-helix domain-containing protein n=1 Tax=Ignatzschineria rhizosphaerae TaxID=2923279 RepID=A0ABY3WZ74_9GAMM|nr:helix-turn-helix domain-containing protein [Ignatzschineria rhizosphaerae]UNM95922.1 helix-turn-helix domain-containing protein [Ignatzschineria rhizosphaerae]